MMNKKTLVIGASLNPEIYSNKAILSLVNHGHAILAFGLKNGVVSDVEIQTELPKNIEIDTVTLYLNPMRQIDYYDYVVQLKPRRVIFNPGTENAEFQTLLAKEGIFCEIACTLVLLSIGNY